MNTKPEKVRVSIGIDEKTNDILWRIIRHDCLHDPDETEEDLRLDVKARARIVMLLMREAAYAVDDWMDRERARGVTLKQLRETMRSIRFDYVPQLDRFCRSWERGEEDAAAEKAIDDLLSKIQ